MATPETQPDQGRGSRRHTAPPGERSRDAAKARTRRALLDAAARRFVQDGFLEASTVSIARDAGVAHGTLFVHFPDRDALLMAVVGELLGELGEDLHRACFQATELESLCRMFLESLSQREDIYAALIKDLPRFQPVLKRNVFATFTAITAHFTMIVERGQATGKLRSIPTAVANAFFFGTLNHYFLCRDLMTADGRVVATHGEQLVEAFMAMMGASPSAHSDRA